MSQLHYKNDPQEYAQKYSELSFHELKCTELRPLTRLIKKYAQGTLALDYGCGPGKSTQYLKSMGFDCEGVDINPHMIAAAFQTDPTGTYEVIASGKIQRLDKYFDFVYSGWTLIHVESKEELAKIMEEIFRVLKPGGCFCLLVNSDERYNKNWFEVDTRFKQNEMICSGSVVATRFKANDYVLYTYFWTEDDYSEALVNAGFQIEKKETCYSSNFEDAGLIGGNVASHSVIYVAKKPW